jgi:hypothetical protein
LGATVGSRRIPWISQKPDDFTTATSNQSGWNSIASGNHDSDIRAHFDALLGIAASANGPIIWTFHHEPQQQGLTASYGTSFNNAFNHIIDIAKARPTWNDRILFAPNYMEWLWRSSTSRDITSTNHLAWFPSSALSKWDFFSWDMYPYDVGGGAGTNTTDPADWETIHPITRIERIFSTLTAVGYPNMMCAIGEFAQRAGLKDSATPPQPITPISFPYPTGTQTGRDLRSGAKWVRMIMDYMTNNPDRFWACAYFSSDGGAALESLLWPMLSVDTESTLSVFKDKLDVSARLQDL